MLQSVTLSSAIPGVLTPDRQIGLLQRGFSWEPVRNRGGVRLQADLLWVRLKPDATELGYFPRGVPFL